MRDFNKIFGIGLSRTGTSSLAAALTELGLRTLHFPRIESYIRAGCYAIAEFDDYDAVLDTPIVPIYKHLDRTYPGSLFIYTEREIRSWLASCQGFFQCKDERERGTFLEDEGAFHRLYTYGCEGFSAERFEQVYRDHEADVLRHFQGRDGDLLRLDICNGDSWGPLCRFLEVEEPEKAFPICNTRGQAAARPGPRYALVTVTDPDYLPITETLLQSFRRHNPWFRGDLVLVVEAADDPAYDHVKRDDRIVIHQVGDELRQRVEAICGLFPSLADVYQRFFTLEAFRLSAYAQLVFLDSDILCTASIRHLFELDRGLHCAPDSCFFRNQLRDPRTHRKVDAGFALSYGGYLEDSFNSGVMVLGKDVRSRAVYDSLLAGVTPETWQGIEVPRLADQIVLNRVFHGKVERLSSRDNFVIFLEDEIEQVEGVAWFEARLLHFAGKTKPWRRQESRGFDFRRWKFIEAWRTEFARLVASVGSPRRLAAIDAALTDGVLAATDRDELSRLVAERARLTLHGAVSGVELRRRRKQARVGRRQLAERLGWPAERLSRIEARLGAVPSPVALQYVEALAESGRRPAPLPLEVARAPEPRRPIFKLLHRVAALFLSLASLPSLARSQTVAKVDPRVIVDKGVITSDWEAHRAREKPSSGVDIDGEGLPEGSKAPVRSPVDGRVTFAGGNFGTVKIQDADGNSHELLHLSEVMVEVGDRVKAGDTVIGLLGNVGADGDHVHLQTKNPNGQHFNPDDFPYRTLEELELS